MLDYGLIEVTGSASVLKAMDKIYKIASEYTSDDIEKFLEENYNFQEFVDGVINAGIPEPSFAENLLSLYELIWSGLIQSTAADYPEFLFRCYPVYKELYNEEPILDYDFEEELLGYVQAGCDPLFVELTTLQDQLRLLILNREDKKVIEDLRGGLRKGFTICLFILGLLKLKNRKLYDNLLVNYFTSLKSNT